MSHSSCGNILTLVFFYVAGKTSCVLTLYSCSFSFLTATLATRGMTESADEKRVQREMVPHGFVYQNGQNMS